MPESKFKVGEMVDFYPSRRGMSASVRSYKILRHRKLPFPCCSLSAKSAELSLASSLIPNGTRK